MLRAGVTEKRAATLTSLSFPDSFKFSKREGSLCRTAHNAMRGLHTPSHKLHGLCIVNAPRGVAEVPHHHTGVQTGLTSCVRVRPGPP